MHLGSCWANHSPSRTEARIRILFCVYKTSKYGQESPYWRLPCPVYRITLPGRCSLPLRLAGGKASGHGLEKKEMQCWNNHFQWKLWNIIEVFKNLTAIFQVCINWFIYDRNTAMQIAYWELFESSNSDWTNWPCIIRRMIRIRGGVFPQYSKVLVNNHNFIIMEIIYNAGRQSQIIEVYHYLFPYFKSEFQTSLTHRHYKHSPINLRNVH